MKINFILYKIKQAKKIFTEFNVNMKIIKEEKSNIAIPVFRSGVRTYKPKILKKINPFGKYPLQTLTNLFREDIDWKQLFKYMTRHFNDKEKVNMYSLACSDGSEAYTTAISVFNFIPKEAQFKYLPIFASDIDTEIINAAKTGRINIYPIEFFNVEQNYGIDLCKYFKDKNVSVMVKGDKISETDTISSYKPVEKLEKSIKFKKSDILTELKKMNDEGNSVVLCRNVFPYLNGNYIEEVVNAAKNNLKEGSLFVIGAFDCRTDINTKLLQNGFFNPCIDIWNVFQRGNQSTITDKLLSGYLI